MLDGHIPLINRRFSMGNTMPRPILVTLLLVTWILTAPAPAGPIPEQLTGPEKYLSQETFRLARELSIARKAANLSKVRELERLLFDEVAASEECEVRPVPPGYGQTPRGLAAPTWGNDVEVFAGAMYPGEGKRQICVCADTAGGIYLALNRVYMDTISCVVIYRSTNGGLDWSSIGSIYSPGRPIQSFDMCVTDTSGGKWLVSLALIVKTSATVQGGGSLLWMSILSDGSHWRRTTIASGGAGIAFRNPSICTDGATYLPNVTYHYVAAEYITPSTDIARGLYIVQSTNRGASWGSPDTTLRAGGEGTPVIAVDFSSNPDSLIVVYARGAYPSREIRIARGAKILPLAWTVTVPSPQPGDNYDPALAIDATRGNAMVTYTRNSGPPNYQDVRCFRSTNRFRTYAHDSIAISTAYEGLSSISFAPWSTGYYWRVAYRSNYSGGTVYYKSLLNKLGSWNDESATVVNQFDAEYSIAPVVSFDRDVSGTQYRGNVSYVGKGPTGVYFDAIDLALDIPEAGSVPLSFSLAQNYPNPFNPGTTIGFAVSGPGSRDVRLAVFDLLGREVALLLDEPKAPGRYNVEFNGAQLSSGVYIYRMTAGDIVESRRMMLLR
jgi:hypothetical protein